MDTLASLQLNKALAYPVIDPPLSLLFSSLLIWENIELIWGEDKTQVDKFRSLAYRTPILYDKGLVSLKEPKTEEIINASEKLVILKPNYEEEIVGDDGFAERFVINPVKVTHAYWESARRRQDGFIDVPKKVGRLYLGLLATEMSTRLNDPVPILTTRIQEPLFLEGGLDKIPENLSPDECIAKAGFNCLVPNVDIDDLDLDDVRNLCEDIKNLRKLDSWHSWREELFFYKRNLMKGNSFAEVKAITTELNKKVEKFEKDICRNRWIVVGKIGITVVGGVVGFFVGSLPGAIVGATTGAASTGIELYQAHSERKERRGKTQQFIIDARKVLRKYSGNGN